MIKGKIRFMLLLFLSLTTTLISCNKNNNQNNGQNNVTSDNYIIIGNNNFNINRAFYNVDQFDNEIDITFSCDDLLLSLELEGYDSIPTEVLELTLNGKYTGDAEVIGSHLDYDITGILAISKVNDSLAVTISGDAYIDRASVPLSLTYRGEIIELP